MSATILANVMAQIQNGQLSRMDGANLLIQLQRTGQLTPQEANQAAIAFERGLPLAYNDPSQNVTPGNGGPPLVQPGGGDNPIPGTPPPAVIPEKPPLSPPGGGLAAMLSGSDPQGDLGMPTQPTTHAQTGAGLRLEKNGEVYFKTDPGEIGQLLQQGYQVRDGNDPNGQLYTPKSFQGGYLVKSGQYWVPVDTLLNGRMTVEQKTALQSGGYQIDPDVQITGTSSTGNASTGGGTTTTGGGTTTTGGVLNTAPLGGSLSDMLKDLMQRSLDQGAAGQKSVNELVDLLRKNSELNATNAAGDRQKRDDLVTQLLGGNNGLNAGFDKVIGQIGQGFDPVTMAALNQQAIEGPQRDYQGQVETLKTALAGRGAYGGGDTPGSLGDIVRGYAPLLTARDTTREELFQKAAFGNQDQKNFNTTAGVNALSGKGTLLGTLGGIYNPNGAEGRSTSALSDALAGTNYGVNAGFKGLDSAGGFANTLNDTSTGSLSSLLKGALLGTGLNVLTQKNAAGKSILGSLISLIPGGGGPQRDPNADWDALQSYLAQNNLPALDPSLRDLLMQNPGVPTPGIQGPQ